MWTGYKVHWTETCDAGQPHLITAVTTTAATTADIAAVALIHTALADQGLLPADHYVDSGYMSVGELQTSAAEHGVRLVGPMRPDSSWQTAAGQGYGVRAFAVDWEAQTVACPTGQTSRTWTALSKGGIGVQFATATCGACAVRAACTKGATGGRGLTLPGREEHVALAGARAEQETAAWKKEYAIRAGIEGTLSQGVRLGDLRQTRYVGAAKTHLQHVLIAVAVNLLRLVAWWQGRTRAGTRTTAFGALATRNLQWKVVPAS